MTRQIAVRLPNELADLLDQLVRDGDYDTTAEAVRAAVRELAERIRREKLDAAIIDGYTRVPPTPDEEAWAGASGRDFLAEEQW